MTPGLTSPTGVSVGVASTVMGVGVGEGSMGVEVGAGPCVREETSEDGDVPPAGVEPVDGAGCGVEVGGGGLVGATAMVMVPLLIARPPMISTPLESTRVTTSTVSGCWPSAGWD